MSSQPTATQAAPVSPTTSPLPFAATESRETVTSRDGTEIGYRRFGSGPALVLLHGSASSSAHHVELAGLLADAFSVIVPDRRGRGLSGPSRPGDVLAQQLDDVTALVDATGATSLWGLSSGAIVALEAASAMSRIRRVAAFEPPLVRDHAAAAELLATYDDEMARGRIGDAMVTAMRGAEMGPGWFRALPKTLTSRLVLAGMRQEAKVPAGEYPTMRELAPTLHDDFAIVATASGDLDRYRSIPGDVLLMGGSRSPAFLKRALDDLAAVLPAARRVELAGLDHAASWNRDRGGNPEPVAIELRTFFGR